MSKIRIRKSDTEKHQAGHMQDGIKRYYDHNLEHTVVKLMTGDCYVTNEPREMLVTILGSCVSVCLRDSVAGVGGMNHILLPGDGHMHSSESLGLSTRFGAFAMEELINSALKLGALKQRLECKLFGGGNVIDTSSGIGQKNIRFVREYLKNEALTVLSEDVGGDHPRRIHYYPDTGKVMLRRLKRKEDFEIAVEEKAYSKRITREVKQDDIELFD